MIKWAADALADILQQNSWVGELAGILPLSALIDFIDTPAKLHIFQLAGAAPLWSWPVTPAGSRLLLSDDAVLRRSCYLDRYGFSVPLIGLDGRFGASYAVANPETVRLCLGSLPISVVDNPHENMKGDDLRIQSLEVIHVSRLLEAPNGGGGASSSWLRYVFMDPWRMYSARYLATSVLGWILWTASISVAIFLGTYISLAFLVAVPATGGVIFILYGSNPRRLLVSKPGTSRANRLILVAEHMNSTHWTAFYGESILVNSLLNRPIEPSGPRLPPAARPVLHGVLRVLILGQWAMALAAAATKDWNSYLLCFWVAFCIFAHAYVIPVGSLAGNWATSFAGIRMERYQTTLSSRRTMLNTILALNPDTFALDSGSSSNNNNNNNNKQEIQTSFDAEALRWIDPILERGVLRTRWEQASLKAMQESQNNDKMESLLPGPSSEWLGEYGNDYWAPFVFEGIQMAARIKQIAGLQNRFVP